MKLAFKYIFTLSLTVFFFGSCAKSNLNSSLQKRLQTINEISAAVNHSNETQDSLSWEHAVNLLEKQNPSIQLSKRNESTLQRNIKNLKREWIPGISSFAGFRADLVELAKAQSIDVDASIFASFQIPNPINYYGRLYASYLQLIRTQEANKLNRRRLYSQLYQAFLDYENSLLEQQIQHLRKNTVTSNISTEQFANELRNSNSQKQRASRIRQNFNQLLNTPGKNWKPNVSTLPKLSFHSNLHTLIKKETFGELARILAACELEAAYLRLQQLKIQDFPILRSSLSSPPLYDSRNDDNFDFEDFRFFTGLTKSFSVNNQSSINKKHAKEDIKLLLKELRLRLKSEHDNLLSAAQSYEQIQLRQKSSSKKLQNIERVISKSTNGATQDILLQYFEAKRTSILTEQQTKRILLQFWIWDETQWNK